LKQLENMKMEISSLKQDVKFLKLKNEELTNAKAASDSKLLSFQNALRDHFTPGQIKRILNPNKKYSSWAPEDIP
jgi:chromosome segregation ATPase